MAIAQPTEHHRFQSRYGGGWLQKGQYLAEAMVARQARKNGTDLPLRFWENDKWKRAFLIQLRFANNLVRIYEVEAVVRALRGQKGKNIYSLGARWLDPLIQDEQRKLDQQKAAAAVKTQTEPPKEEMPTPTAVSQPPRKPFETGKSLFDKLGR